jgi:hypothetical protein
MDADQHRIMSPKSLFLARKEYHDNFSLVVFRKHIYQEERRRKFLAQLRSKKSKSPKVSREGGSIVGT